MNMSNFSSAADSINEWIKDKTQNSIADIITEKYLVNSNSVIFLCANYFSGRWLNKFSVYNTNLLDFQMRDGTRRKSQF